MKLIWVNCFLPLDCCYLLATANVAALFLRWSVFPYVLTETAQFSTQHSVSKTKIAIREALHVSKQMYHYPHAFVFYSVWKWDTANRRYRTLPYSYVFSFTYRARYSADKLYTLVCTSGTVAIRLHVLHHQATEDGNNEQDNKVNNNNKLVKYFLFST